MEPSNLELWGKINSFDLTAPDSRVTFEEQLAAENGWTHGYALLVTREYRKFIYLTQVAGQMVCPSDEVAQAWHLHITHTVSYRAFCANALQGFLHHHASKGGPAELQRHQEMYSFTLKKYREIFGTKPAPALWPPVHERFAKSTSSDAVVSPTMSRSMVLNRPGRAWAVAIALGFLTSNVLGDILWTSNTGARFLIFFVLALIFVSWIPTLFSKAQVVGVRHKTLDPYEAAYLQDGLERMQGTATARLVDLGALKLQPEREAGKETIKGATCSLNAAFEAADGQSLHTVETRGFFDQGSPQNPYSCPMTIGLPIATLL